MAGRPTLYTTELAEAICETISTTSKGIHKVAEIHEIGVTSIFKWLNEYPEFAKLYARAREAQADFMGSEILDIVDDGTNDYMTIEKGDNSYNVEDREVTSRSKMRYEARKWLMSKLAPKKFGDKIEVDQTVTIKEVPEWLKDKPDGSTA